MLILFSNPIYKVLAPPQPDIDPTSQKLLDSLVAHWPAQETSKNMERSESVTLLFGFDPNQVPKEDLEKLGFSPNMANRVINYRSKGGRFMTKSDLLKIYGMDSSFYNRLYPFIRLPEEIAASPTKPVFPRKENVAFTSAIDINKADTTVLESVYGIGPKLARRIITFRDALGGFVDIEQLKQVYGLDSAVVKRLQEKFYIEPAFSPRQININTASEKELAAHPYIKMKKARAIVTYRYQHGTFGGVEDLGKIHALDVDLDRLRPYVKVNE